MFFDDFEPPGILHRIPGIPAFPGIPGKWGGRLRLRTPLPHAPGARMTVVYKLPQMSMTSGVCNMDQSVAGTTRRTSVRGSRKGQGYRGPTSTSRKEQGPITTRRGVPQRRRLCTFGCVAIQVPPKVPRNNASMRTEPLAATGGEWSIDADNCIISYIKSYRLRAHRKMKPKSIGPNQRT